MLFERKNGRIMQRDIRVVVSLGLRKKSGNFYIYTEVDVISISLQIHLNVHLEQFPTV